LRDKRPNRSATTSLAGGTADHRDLRLQMSSIHNVVVAAEQPENGEQNSGASGTATCWHASGTLVKARKLPGRSTRSIAAALIVWERWMKCQWAGSPSFVAFEFWPFS